MPQFDQFSFYNQISWFILFFFSFYFFISYYFLPKICSNIKLRKKKIILDNNKKIQINFEKNNIIFFMNNFYKNFCLNFELFFSRKLLIYKSIEILKVQNQSIINLNFKNQINNFLNKKFLFFKKILINI